MEEVVDRSGLLEGDSVESLAPVHVFLAGLLGHQSGWLLPYQKYFEENGKCSHRQRQTIRIVPGMALTTHPSMFLTL